MEWETGKDVFCSYPIVDLKLVRTLRHDAHTPLAKDIDSRTERKADQEAQNAVQITFEVFALTQQQKTRGG